MAQKGRKRSIIIVVGPTASGKSAFAVSLAKKLDGEIISADSRQVYRGLDIGTGKITKREMRSVPHHLLDVASSKKIFTAHDFASRAGTVIEEIFKRGKIPIVVGGTGFYIDALVGRISLPDVAPDPDLRARLEKKTAAQLYALLQKRDPRTGRRLSTPSERNNKVRLIRALEIAAARTEDRPPYTSPGPEDRPPYKVRWIGLMPADLDERIRLRLRSRIKAGMIAEGRRLHRDGLSYKRMRELGLEYRALADLLTGKIRRDEFEKRLGREIRRYAKKQLAYWRRNKKIRWIDPADDRRMRALEHALMDR